MAWSRRRRSRSRRERRGGGEEEASPPASLQGVGPGNGKAKAHRGMGAGKGAREEAKKSIVRSPQVLEHTCSIGARKDKAKAMETWLLEEGQQ